VQTKWNGLYSHGEEFRLILDKIIELLAIKKVGLIIADARKMKIISPEDQHWIVQDWYPRAVKAGFNFEVLIVSKDTFNERSINKIVHQYDDKKVRTIYFYSFSQATHWLLDNATQLLEEA
jgi:hypothetical protein